MANRWDTCSQLPASETPSGFTCRHMDGVWRSADDVPRGRDGRILAHVALNGHGSYPTAGFIPRNLLAFNDYTSNQGAVWDPVSHDPLPRMAFTSCTGCMTRTAPRTLPDTRLYALNHPSAPVITHRLYPARTFSGGP